MTQPKIEDKNTFRRLGPLVKNVVRRSDSKRRARELERADG
jgi:hypothetical protein